MNFKGQFSDVLRFPSVKFLPTPKFSDEWNFVCGGTVKHFPGYSR